MNPSVLNNQLVERLKTIMKEDYKKNLTKEEVFEFANSLVSYFDLLRNIKINNKYEHKYRKDEN